MVEATACHCPDLGAVDSGSGCLTIAGVEDLRCGAWRGWCFREREMVGVN